MVDKKEQIIILKETIKFLKDLYDRDDEKELKMWLFSSKEAVEKFGQHKQEQLRKLREEI